MPPKKKSTQPTTEPTKEVSVVVDEVLRGLWGSYDGLREKLTEQGYDASEVFTGVNTRLAKGAPSAFKPSLFQIADSVKRGEWGSSEGLEARLRSAGFNPTDVKSTK